ncbi:MAG: metallophosphoesterase [bacterium]
MFLNQKLGWWLIIVSMVLMLFHSGVQAVDFRFVVMADSRSTTSSYPVNITELQLIMSRITTLNPPPQFVVFPGDMIIGGGGYSYSTISWQLQTWKDTVTVYKPASFFYLGVGNHETNNGAAYAAETAFNNIFPEFVANNELAGYNKTVYSFDYDNSRFIMLNSNHVGTGFNHKIDTTQRAWLTPLLTGKTHYFVFFHEPAYPTGNHIGSSLDVNSTDRDALWQLLDNANVSIVFVGHEHFYSRRHIDNTINPSYNHYIYQVTTGTCGAPIYSSSNPDVDVPPIPQYHFAVVDVSGADISVNVYQDNMTLLDNFTVTRTIPISCIDFWSLINE